MSLMQIFNKPIVREKDDSEFLAPFLDSSPNVRVKTDAKEKERRILFDKKGGNKKV